MSHKVTAVSRLHTCSNTHKEKNLTFPDVKNSASLRGLTESGSGTHTAQTGERLQVFTTESGSETTTPPLKTAQKCIRKFLKRTFCVSFV